MTAGHAAHLWVHVGTRAGACGAHVLASGGARHGSGGAERHPAQRLRERAHRRGRAARRWRRWRVGGARAAASAVGAADGSDGAVAGGQLSVAGSAGGMAHAWAAIVANPHRGSAAVAAEILRFQAAGHSSCRHGRRQPRCRSTAAGHAGEAARHRSRPEPAPTSRWPVQVASRGVGAIVRDRPTDCGYHHRRSRRAPVCGIAQCTTTQSAHINLFSASP